MVIKISIPREAVERIVADYGCTEEEAAKAFLDVQDRTKEAYRKCLTERFDQPRSGASTMPRIFTPKEIKVHPDKTVIVDDISRECFQQSVLKLIERKLVSIHNPLSATGQMQEMISLGKGKKGSRPDNMVSTENILYRKRLKTLFRRIGPELHGGQRTLQDHTRDGGGREVLR